MKRINSYEDFLLEGVNDNFLYHTTSIRNLNRILKSDILKKGEGNSVSFSRNRNFWFGHLTYNSIRLVINKSLLSQHYKIETFDFFRYKTVWDEESKKDIRMDTKKWDINRTKDYEYEERVKHDIMNIGRYISEIEFSEISLGLNVDYQALGSFDLPELQETLNTYVKQYPYIKTSIVNIDNKYIKGGLIQIKRKSNYDN